MFVCKIPGIKAIVIDQIRQLAAQYDIQRVLLFGSRARGDYRPRSDIDLAISGGNTAAFTLAVDEETDTLLKYDVVNLDGAVQPELLLEIEKDGKVLYEKSLRIFVVLWIISPRSSDIIPHMTPLY